MGHPTATRLKRIFAVPLLIAAVSLVGLVAALMGNGVFDVLSWLALAVPLAATVWAMKVRRR